MSVSGYVRQGHVKYSAPAFHKTTTYKGHSRNHLPTKSRASASAPKTESVKTTSSTPSVTASPWP